MLLDTFYVLQKDYGTCILFTKVTKGVVDDTTGEVTGGNQTYPLDAVISPTGIETQYLLSLLGRIEKFQTVFLIRVCDLPPNLRVETTDYFMHGNLKYQNLQFEDYDGVLLALTGSAPQ